MSVYIQKFQDGGKPTFQVGSKTIDLETYANQLNNDFQRFYDTYADTWSNKRKNEVVEQHKEFMSNLVNGNITGLNLDGTFNVNDAANTKIDFRTNKAGEIHAWYAAQEANYLLSQEQQKPKKKFTNTSLDEGFMNHFFGGSTTPDYASFLNLDSIVTDDAGVSTRPNTNRVKAIANYLNTIDLSKYDSIDENLGDVQQKINTLRNNLQSGNISPEDYSIAASLGFNIRRYLQTEAEPENNKNTSDSNTPETTLTPEQKLQKYYNNTTVEDMANLIDSWDTSEISSRIGRADTSLQQDIEYYSKRKNPYVGTAEKYITKYNNEALPVFMQYIATNPTFSPEYLKNHINEQINLPNWKGLEYKHKYIANNMTRAIELKRAGHLALEISEQLNPVKELPGFWTVPRSFNEKYGTIYVYNPASGEYRTINIKKYNSLLRSYLDNKGYGVQKQQYGGTIQEYTPINLSQYEYKEPVKETPEQQVQKAEQQKLEKQQKEQEAQDKYLNDKSKGFTNAEYRELSAFAADLAAIGLNVTGFTPGAAISGLSSTALRTYNDATDEDGYTLGDFGSTVLGVGLDLAALLPEIGAAARTASMAKKVSEAFPIILAGAASYGLVTSASPAYNAMKDVLSGKRSVSELSINEWRDIGSVTTAVLGFSAHKAGQHKAAKSWQKAGEQGLEVSPGKASYDVTVAEGKKTKLNLTQDEAKTVKSALKKGKSNVISKLKQTEAYSKLSDADKAALDINKINLSGRFRPSKVTEFSWTKSGELSGELTNPNFSDKAFNAGIRWSRNDMNLWDLAKKPFKWFFGTPDYNVSYNTGAANRKSIVPEAATTPKPSTAEPKPVVEPKPTSTESAKPITEPSSTPGNTKLFSGTTIKPANEWNAKYLLDVIDYSNKSMLTKLVGSFNLSKVQKDNLIKAINNATLSKTQKQKIADQIVKGVQFKMIDPKTLYKLGGKLSYVLNTYKQGGILKGQQGLKPFGRNTGIGLNTNSNWYKDVASKYMDSLLDSIKNDDDIKRINDWQLGHYNIYTAANKFGDWRKTAYQSDAVKKYQQLYSGLTPENSINYNLSGIANAMNTGRYILGGKRLSKDWGNSGWTPDGLYSQITDDRRVLGRQGDYTDEDLNTFNTKLKSKNIEMYLDPKTNYYMLRKIETTETTPKTEPTNPADKLNQATQIQGKKIDLNSIYNKVAPATLGAIRALSNSRFNTKNSEQYIRDLQVPQKQSYHTYRQTVGDYFAQQSAANAATRIQQLAKRAHTSDASRNAAIDLEAADKANEYYMKGEAANQDRIRKTGELAAQHHDQNIARDTEIANWNREKLVDHANTIANIRAANRTQNHDIWWNKWYPSYVELPIAQDIKEKKAIQKYLDWEGLKSYIGPEDYRQSSEGDMYMLGQQEKLRAATTDAERQAIISETSRELAKRQQDYSNERFRKIAQHSGLNYNYKRTFTPQSVATPTYIASSRRGGSVDLLKEKNKDIDRLWKQIQKISERFYRQYSRMK